MSFIQEIKERRLFQWVVSYAAAGWIALSVLDQLADRGVVPNIVYVVGLVWYVGGLFAATIIGWYHGEKGAQEVPRAEVLLLSMLTVALLGMSGWTVVQNRGAIITAADLGGAFDPNRIAVLYFDDASGDDQALADGLTESLIEELARVGALSVVSRNGSAEFRNSALASDSIARVLDAGTFVTGTVDRRGDDVQVSVSLRESEGGNPIDRLTVTRGADDVLALRDEVASEVALALRSWLGREIELRRRQGDTENPRAWIVVQRAQSELRSGEARALEGDLDAAVGAFDRADALIEEARELESTWVEPVNLAGQVSFARGRFLGRRDREVARQHLDAGLQHAQEALAMDPANAAALEYRGAMRYYRYARRIDDDDQFREQLLNGAREDLERATEIDEGRAGPHYWLSQLRYANGDIAGAVIDARRAYQADAYLTQAAGILRRLYLSTYDLAQFGEAERWCAEGHRRFENDWRFIDCQLWLKLTPVATPDVDGAWALREQMLELVPEGQREMQGRLTQLIVGGVIMQAGMADSAQVVLETARAGVDIDPDQELLGYEAVVRSIVGDTDTSIQLLKRYLSANPGHDFEIAGGLHWWYQNLAADPEFRALRSSG
jgi:TolB-like protein